MIKKLFGLLLIVCGLLSAAFWTLGTILCIIGEVEASVGVTLVFVILAVLSFLIFLAGRKLFKTQPITQSIAEQITEVISQKIIDECKEGTSSSADESNIHIETPVNASSHNDPEQSFFDLPDLSDLPENSRIEKTYQKSNGTTFRIKIKIGEDDSQKYVAVECSNCGAPATIKKGSTAKCEYCDTYIQG